MAKANVSEIERLMELNEFRYYDGWRIKEVRWFYIWVNFKIIK